MANIFDLTVDVILYIFRFLLIEDRIAFVLSSERFRQLCVREEVFRKMDVSRCLVSTTQRSKINKFFRDTQLTQHIRELNISNLHVWNWQVDKQLEESIVSVCPHLEALHVLSCGMSLERLERIVKQAPRLTALSWSLSDLTYADIRFLSKSMRSSEGLCFRNIKHFHLETPASVPHIQIVKCLLLSCFKDLEEVEIYIWPMIEISGWNFPFSEHQMIPGFPQPSVENELQHLHSLMLVEMESSNILRKVATDDNDDDHDVSPYETALSDLVVSVLSRKSSSTKWKKLWILPSIEISTMHLTDLSLLLKNDFQSVEAIAVNPGTSANAVNELKTFFKWIGDNTLRNLHLHLPRYTNSIVEFCELISRVGWHSLKLLRLFVPILDGIPTEQNIVLHSLFSACKNIAELDLVGCCFRKDICESLSELRHLTKVQLEECAVSSKQSSEDHVEISWVNLVTFVENCKNITHFEVHVCPQFYNSGFLGDSTHLLALAKLGYLKSLTLYDISGIREWTFLQKISEHCKFLTTLRISAYEQFENSHIPLLMESAKFLQHLAMCVSVPVLDSEIFWNLLSHAKNLQRLCIRSCSDKLLNVPVAVETLKSLPQLRVLHLHSGYTKNFKEFYDQIIRMLEKNDCRFSLEIITGKRKTTWISQTGRSFFKTGHSSISKRVLPLNEAELCEMTPILDIPGSSVY